MQKKWWNEFFNHAAPFGSEITYQDKAGKYHSGCTANVEESVGNNVSAVTDYQFDSNNKSDGEFFQEHIEKIESQESKPTLSDGEYSGEENTSLAAKSNIDLVTTDLAEKM